MANRAIAPNGSPIPWYTYPAIDFLKRRNFSGKNVLEFGGGQSTLWWAARATHVTTIEEDYAWFAHLARTMPANVELKHLPADTLSRSMADVSAFLVEQGRKYEVIVVDGHLRREATALAFDYLAPGGALILDNAEGYGFFEETSHRACRRIDFWGYAPGVSLPHCTSIVFQGDCFLLAPDIPIRR